MQLTAKALWVIERNFGNDLTLGSIAESCGVSPFHLAHAFGAATGKSVMSYVRGRRLTEAARALANGAPDILSVALESGYASHEAFTRAFREHFGTTPETVKRNASFAALPLVQPIELTEGKPAMLEEPKIVSRGAMTFIGLVERQAFDAPHLIALQWQKFMAMYGLVEKKVSEIPVGLSFNLHDEGTFDYACAVEVARDADVPKGLQRIAVAPQSLCRVRTSRACGADQQHLSRDLEFMADRSQQDRRRCAEPRTPQGNLRSAHGRRRHRYLDSDNYIMVAQSDANRCTLRGTALPKTTAGNARPADRSGPCAAPLPPRRRRRRSSGNHDRPICRRCSYRP